MMEKSKEESKQGFDPSTEIRSPRNLQEEDELVIEQQKDSGVLEEYVLSMKRPYGKYSFMKGGPVVAFNAKFPPPINLPHQMIYLTRDLLTKDIMEGIVMPEKGGLECIDKNVLDRQKGLMTEVIVQVVKCVLTGQPISGISLPVRVFEPRSQIERMLDIFGFAPIFFKRAALMTDRLQRLKLVITSVIAGMYGSAKQLKPFNPLLGETYQGYFDDGTRIYCEHTSHHPPISNFLIQGPFLESVGPGEESKEEAKRMWTLSGYYEFTGEKDGDSFKVGQKGPNRLDFHDGHRIEWVNPVFKLSVSGARYMSYTGDITFFDKIGGLKATIIVDYTRQKSGWFGSVKRTGKVDDFEGVIYSIDYDKFMDNGFHEQRIYEWKHPQKLEDIKDKAKVVSEIKGSWLKSLQFDGKTYWELDDKIYKPWPQRPTKNPLPSDWRFRQDLIWLKYEKEAYADCWKKELEKMQRLDRKWRKQRK